LAFPGDLKVPSPVRRGGLVGEFADGE